MKYMQGRRVRYAVPVVVMAVIGSMALVPALSGAAAPPTLPAQSAQQILVDMSQARVPQLSGSLTWTANLGLSDLSSLEAQLGGQGGSASAANTGTGTTAGVPSAGAAAGSTATVGLDPLSFLSGSDQIGVWLDGANAEHLALIEPQAEEVDFVRSGDDVWLWNSAADTATHLVGAGAATTTTTTATTAPAAAALTPQQWAARLLDHISPTTSVTVGGAVYVAGQAAYQLLVAPKGAAGTTVDHIEVDVGATGPLFGVPLQVAIYSAGQAAPALALGFSGQINLGTPPASEFTFTPPPGATVVTHDLSALKVGNADRASGPHATTALNKIGSGWAVVVAGTESQLAGAASGGELAAVSSVVQVGGQSARLFSTNLLNVLIMPDGHFYAGFVTPAVLEAAASTGS
jgi:outer membrane lipoprotein-sorting protein